MCYGAFSSSCRRLGFGVLVSSLALALASGCANYQVRIADSDPMVPHYEGRTMHAYFWGLVMNPEILHAKCEQQAINDVEVRRNFLHDLASVLTLGIWMPLEIRYRCNSPDTNGGHFPK
jgi:hypothetical protein